MNGAECVSVGAHGKAKNWGSLPAWPPAGCLRGLYFHGESEPKARRESIWVFEKGSYLQS